MAIFKGLDQDTAHTFVRLHSRSRQPVRIDSFNPPGIDDVSSCLSSLRERGLVDTSDMVSSSQALMVMRVAELKEACRHFGLPTGGKKADLQRRLVHHPKMKHPEMVKCRHAKLFRRLLRAGLQDHQGHLTKTILHELGLRPSPNYPLTTGSGRFPNRLAMRNYEDALAWAAHTDTATSAISHCRLALTALRASGEPEEFRYRFSAKRFWGSSLLSQLRNAERTETLSEVASIYRSAIEHDPRNSAHYTHRLALVEDRLGNTTKALSRCISHQGTQAISFGIHRTGRRLARKCAMPYAINQTTVAPDVQQLDIRWHKKGALWHGPEGASLPIEQAVIQWLQQRGRRSHFTEGRFWTSLFALLYEQAMFAPVEGMLPCPHLTKPMDLGTPGFWTRREKLIEKIHQALLEEGPTPLIEAAWNRRAGENIAGVSWTQWSLEQISDIAESIGAASLISVMKVLLKNWRRAARGLPDLVVLPGEPVKSRGFHLPGHAVWAEVKGPGDALRDEQRWWIRELNCANIDVQVWRVRMDTSMSVDTTLLGEQNDH